MRKKYLIMFILLLSMLFVIFVTGCTNQPSNEQQCDCSFCNEQPYKTFLYERDFPNFVTPYDRTVDFTHDELLDAFNFIADYWEANPYCDIINAIEVLRLCEPSSRVRVGLDNDSEELRVAFRTHVLDSSVISLEDIRRGMPTIALGTPRLSSSIFFGTEVNRLSDTPLNNNQQKCFTFAELRDTMSLVTDITSASRLAYEVREIRNAITALYLCVSSNRVKVVLFDYSEELKETFRAEVTDSPAISFVAWAGTAPSEDAGK